MTMESRPRATSTPYIVMAILIGIAIASIAAQIVLGITGNGELADAINPVTFATLSAFFLVFGLDSGRKAKPVQSAGGYVAAGCWALYTVLLIAGFM